jgi:hypothetical protein
MNRLFALFVLMIVALLSLSGCNTIKKAHRMSEDLQKNFWSLAPQAQNEGIAQGHKFAVKGDDYFDLEGNTTRRQMFTVSTRLLNKTRDENIPIYALAIAALLLGIYNALKNRQPTQAKNRISDGTKTTPSTTHSGYGLWPNPDKDDVKNMSSTGIEEPFRQPIPGVGTDKKVTAAEAIPTDKETTEVNSETPKEARATDETQRTIDVLLRIVEIQGEQLKQSSAQVNTLVSAVLNVSADLGSFGGDRGPINIHVEGAHILGSGNSQSTGHNRRHFHQAGSRRDHSKSDNSNYSNHREPDRSGNRGR